MSIHASTSQDPFGPRIRQLAARLETSSSKFDRIEQSENRADRYLDSSAREFDYAWTPQRQASYDSAHQDVSWAGHQLSNYFDRGSRELDWAERQLDGAERELRGLESEMQAAEHEFNALVRELQNADDARAQGVEQAKQEFLVADRSVDTIANSWRRIDSDGRFVDSDIRQSESHIRWIQLDSPGQDVSHYARSLGFNMRSIERGLDRIGRELDDSIRAGQQGERSLDSAARTLRGL